MLRRFPKIDDARQIVFSRVQMPQFGIPTHKHIYVHISTVTDTISPYLNHEYVSRTKSKVVLPLTIFFFFFYVKEKHTRALYKAV